MKATKKDFDRVAAALRHAKAGHINKEQAIAIIESELLDVFISSNPAFNKRKFELAAGREV